jgi:outer membrane protein TolC
MSGRNTSLKVWFFFLNLILVIGQTHRVWANQFSLEVLPKELAPLHELLRSVCKVSPGVAEVNSALRVQAQRELYQARYWIPSFKLFADLGIQESGTDGWQQLGWLENSRGRLGMIAELNLNPLLGPYLKSRREQLRLDRARLSSTLVIQEKLAEVAELALQLVVLKSRSEDLEITRARLDRQFRTVQANVRAGVQKTGDQSRFEADLLRNSEARIGLQREIKEAEEKLKTLSGNVLANQSSTQLGWRSLFDLKIDNIEAITTSPRLEQAKLETELSELDRGIVSSETGLTLGLSSGLETMNSRFGAEGASNFVRESLKSSWFLQAQVRYPLWDNGADSLKLKEASEAQRVAQLTMDQATREFESGKDLFRDEKSRLEERIRLAERLRELELKSFQLVATEYREGRAGYLDWIGASQSLQESIRVQIDLAKEWAKLWFKVKRLKGELARGLCEDSVE